MKRQVVGLVGTPASGKGIVAEYLKSKGFKIYSLSDILRDRLKTEGREPTRDNMVELGNKLRKQYGNDYLAASIKKIIEKTNDELIVIDSIRNPGEVKFLKDNLDALIIAVIAAPERSFEFMKKRNRHGDPETWKEFKKVYEKELGIGQDENGLQLASSMREADIKIENLGSKEELQLKAFDVLTSKNILQ